MGGKESKAENTGISQNVNISNEDPIRIHNQEILFILYGLAAMKILELAYYFVKNYKQHTKEKITRSLGV
jgi:hypothetical protein